MQKKLAADPEDAGLKQQVATAETTLKQAMEKVQVATKAATTAAKTLVDATAAQKEADEAKKAADQAAMEAREFATAAQQEKQRADQKASQTQQQANKRAVNFNIISNPVTISIAEYPVKSQGPETAIVKQGESTEIAFKVERLFGFNANVSVQSQLPQGVGGLQMPNVTIAANQTEGKVKVTAAANATPGMHAINVRLQMSFNGQNLIVEHPVQLTVVEVKAAP